MKQKLPSLGWIVIALALSLYSCQPDDRVGKTTLFEEVDPEQTMIRFVNKVENSEDFNIFNYRNFYNGGGVGIGDINNDGLPEIYLTSNMGDNKLYLNKGNWQFEDITNKAGVASAGKWSTGVVMVDLNEDGLLDIYVCNAGFQKGTDQKNELYINQGDETFLEQGAKYGLDDNGYTTHAAFFDYDRDGDLDVYLLNNSFIPTNTLNYANERDRKAEDWPVKDYLKGGGDKLLKNNEGIYSDASDEAGIYQSLIGFGLGVTVGDVNDDGWDDLYVCNDFFERDYLYLNNQRGGFDEKLEEYFPHISHSSMGADMQDINNDGLPDIFVTDMMPRSEYRLKSTAAFDDINLRRLKVKQGFYNQFMHNTLQVNVGGAFKDIAFTADVAASEWSWGALMFDADNDGYADLLVCNGIYHDVIDLDFMDFFANDMLKKMALSGEKEKVEKVIENMPSVPVPNQAFKNLDGYHFEEVGEQWGLAKPSFSNGAAYGDLDGDGDYDLVINNVNQPLSVYRNNSTNRSLSIRLKGPKVNAFGIGSKVFAYKDEQVLSKQLYPNRGFQSSVGYKVIFGGEDDAKFDSLRVVWPDGIQQVIYDVEGSTLQVNYQDAKVVNSVVAPQEVWRTEDLNTLAKHNEDDYVDYYNERGIYRMLSKEGPASAVGDVNGDGMDDLFIGGAAGQMASLYLSSSETLEITKQPIFELHKDYEDVVASFADVDGDSDLDLVVGSGGNHLKPNDPLMIDRLYLNDGMGHFAVSEGFKVAIGMNTSSIVPIDYDEDGDMDLFIGSRSVPMNYGYSPVHFLMENNGQGFFNDVSQPVFDSFKGFGSVTAAAAFDFDGQGSRELVMVGEWEHPRVFTYIDGRFEERKTDLERLGGWYSAVSAADMNGDGREDLVLGNAGTNCYLKASSEEPLKLWFYDFDNNGFADKIISYEREGKDVPMHQKKELADQIVSIKKQSLKNHDYATKTMEDLFGGEQLDKASVKIVEKMESYIALHEGGGTFEIVDLPVQAQLSSIKAISVSDVDQDGDSDLLIGGNDYNFVPQLSRLDASYGACLVNDGNGSMQFVDESESGIMVKGEVKNILQLGAKYVFVRNNQSPAFIIRNIK